VDGEGECIRVVCVEDGTLGELLEVFLEVTLGFAIPSGSVVVIGSLSHLAWAGAAAYAEALVEAMSRVRSTFSRSVEAVHGFPILQTGIADRAVIRALIDVELWIDTMNIPKGRDISLTRKKAYSFWFSNTVPIACENLEAGPPMAPASASGSGTPMAPGTDPLVYMLPVNLTTRDKSACRSPGFNNVPVSILPLEPVKEADLLLQLVKELNENFFLELSDDIEVSDKTWLDVEADCDVTKKFILVGNSHVSRLALALEDAGHEVSTISLSGGTLTEDSVENAKYQLEDMIRDADPATIVVYFIFDNNVYQAKGPDDTISTPQKIRGKHHVIGELCVVNREDFKQIFNMSVPLLRAGGDNNKVVLSPLMRYAQAPCCADDGHCTNFGDKAYREMLGEALAHLDSWIKDFTFSKRIRNFKVISATEAVTMNNKGKILKSRVLKSNLGLDPVHLTSSGYTQLASVVSEYACGDFTRAKRKTVNPGGSVKVSNLCTKRQKWVMEDDVTAPRAYNKQLRGGGRPYRGQNGRRGGRRGGGFVRGNRGGRFFRGN
jgi:hypothetical protein